MICSCGGFTKNATFRGEDYPVCSSCGRANPPECLRNAREVAAIIRSRTNMALEGKQVVSVGQSDVPFLLTQEVMDDAAFILGEQFANVEIHEGVMQ